MANHRKVNTKPNRFSTAAACAFLALVLLLLSVVSGVYAKYVWGMERKSAVSAPNFYFTSDLLAENPKTYRSVSKALENGEIIGLSNLKISGDDLAKLGVQPGPEMGRMIDCFLCIVNRDPKKNEKSVLVKMVKELMER